MTKASGIVYLVGAGPGDPDLLTLRGSNALSKADVVIYDALISPRLLALCPQDSEMIFVGKRRGHQEMSQAEINRLLVEHARAGRTVVRLKGGDPYVFGRGAEEAETLAANGIAFRVIPGVTAGIGASAWAGIPVTHRDHASAALFVTGHDDPDSPDCRIDWPHLANFRGTIAIYMGVTRLVRIAQMMIEHGKAGETPVALIERGSWPDQKIKVMQLNEIASHQPNTLLIQPPALVVIGDVVKLRPTLDWFSQLPLAGQRVLITRPEADAGRTIQMLEEQGAEVFSAPSITVGPIADKRILDSVLIELQKFDWLVFTSANGVRYFIERLFQIGKDIRSLGHLKLAAIGPSTAEKLREYGLIADLLPEKYRSEELADALKHEVGGKKVLLARADRGRTLLKDELEGIASEVVQVPVYCNADAESFPDELLNKIQNGEIDWVTLTSSAIARRFSAIIENKISRDCIKQMKFASISPVTSSAAREAGIEITVEASEYTIPGLIQAMIKYSESN